MYRLIFLLIALFGSPILAQNEDLPPPEVEAVPETPEPPLPVQSGEILEPDITIIRRGEDIVQEYRVNGQLYMIKVVPKHGRPYYLIDSDHDGTLDVRRSDIEEGIRIHQWKIFSWK